jgi:hypothetical protein
MVDWCVQKEVEGHRSINKGGIRGSFKRMKRLLVGLLSIITQRYKQIGWQSKNLPVTFCCQFPLNGFSVAICRLTLPAFPIYALLVEKLKLYKPISEKVFLCMWYCLQIGTVFGNFMLTMWWRAALDLSCHLRPRVVGFEAGLYASLFVGISSR